MKFTTYDQAQRIDDKNRRQIVRQLNRKLARVLGLSWRQAWMMKCDWRLVDRLSVWKDVAEFCGQATCEVEYDNWSLEVIAKYAADGEVCHYVITVNGARVDNHRDFLDWVQRGQREIMSEFPLTQ